MRFIAYGCGAVAGFATGSAIRMKRVAFWLPVVLLVLLGLMLSGGCTEHFSVIFEIDAEPTDGCVPFDAQINVNDLGPGWAYCVLLPDGSTREVTPGAPATIAVLRDGATCVVEAVNMERGLIRHAEQRFSATNPAPYFYPPRIDGRSADEWGTLTSMVSTVIEFAFRQSTAGSWNSGIYYDRPWRIVAFRFRCDQKEADDSYFCDPYEAGTFHCTVRNQWIVENAIKVFPVYTSIQPGERGDPLPYAPLALVGYPFLGPKNTDAYREVSFSEQCAQIQVTIEDDIGRRFTGEWTVRVGGRPSNAGTDSGGIKEGANDDHE